MVTCQNNGIRHQLIHALGRGCLGVLIFSISALAGQLRVVPQQNGDDFPLVSADKQAAAILIDPEDADVIGIAAKAFAGDVAAVTGVEPKILNTTENLPKYIVLAGSWEKCRWMKPLLEQKGVDAKHIADNAWESYLITVVDKPFDGVEQALVVAGSDRRGTAFGLFEVSRAIGVSPWVWWADVTPDKLAALYLQRDTLTFGPPSVQYRGLFINDEDWGLLPWAKNYEPDKDPVGPRVYERVFELLLRLRANHIWPAMHEAVRYFNYYPENKVVADRYAIVMGSAHCEPLLYNNASEWNTETMGQWRYDTNREKVYEVLDQRVRKNGKYENVYTVGMRGIHDSPMIGNLALQERITLLEKVFADQREILEKNVGQPAATIPQVFIPYNEVLTMYRNGLNVPDDITMMWVDDNHGRIRFFSNELEQRRSGGAGVYFHISYLGPPRPYLWLASTPNSLTWKEMKRAWDTHARRVWIVNVGDIKPLEIGTEFFLDMAWDIKLWDETNLDEFMRQAMRRDIDAELGDKVAELLHDYFTLNYQRRPSFMGFNRGWWGRPILDPQFSLYHYGDECQRRIDAFDELSKKARSLYEQVPPHRKDAYYQLVLYPIIGAAELNKKFLYAYKSRAYAAQHRSSANDYADKALQAYQTIEAETAVYNNTLASGKWRGMMSHQPIGYEDTVFHMVETARIQPLDAPRLGVALEGGDNPLKPIRDDGPQDFDRGETVVLKADQADLGGEMKRITVDERTVLQYDGSEGNLLQGPTQHRATFPVEVKEGGTYTLYARVNHPTPQRDSWYFQMDDDPFVVFNNQQGQWQEFVVLKTFLTPGRHTVLAAARETGAALEQVRLEREAFIPRYADTAELPTFNSYMPRRYFIDVFNMSAATLKWSASVSAPWLRLSQTEGTIGREQQRIWVDIDAAELPQSVHHTGTIDITGAGQAYSVAVKVFHPNIEIDRGTFVQENDVIRINAGNCTRIKSGTAGSWKSVPHLSYNRASMALFPFVGWRIDDLEQVTAQAALLEYPIYVFEPGSAKLRLDAIAAFPTLEGQPVRCGVSLDDGQPQWVTFDVGMPYQSKDPAAAETWSLNVLRGLMYGRAQMDISQGQHVLKIWGVDPVVNLDGLTLDFGGEKPSYLNPPETLIR